ISVFLFGYLTNDDSCPYCNHDNCNESTLWKQAEEIEPCSPSIPRCSSRASSGLGVIYADRFAHRGHNRGLTNRSSSPRRLHSFNSPRRYVYDLLETTRCAFTLQRTVHRTRHFWGATARTDRRTDRQGLRPRFIRARG